MPRKSVSERKLLPLGEIDPAKFSCLAPSLLCILPGDDFGFMMNRDRMTNSMTKKQEAIHSSMRRSLQTALALALMSVGGLTASASLAVASSSVQLQTFKSHSRLEISLDGSVETEWKEENGGFALLLKGMTLADLSLGGSNLASLRDTRLANVRMDETDAGVIIHGKWNFGKGESLPVNPLMEKFSYREQSPSRLVIDFWPKAGVTVGETKKLEKERIHRDSILHAEGESKKKANRRTAALEAIAVSSDVARFCKEPLNEESDIFLEFVPFHENADAVSAGPVGPPDENYPFLTPKKGAPDEKYVSLALELYAKHDYALALRTLDFFEKESPGSIHRVDMRFLRANALMHIELKAPAEALFESIRESSPGTPAALASALYLAEEKRRAGNDLQVIERYLWIAGHYPKHREVGNWRMLAAEALYRIKQTDRAVKEYEWIVANATTQAARADAALRIGDAYLFRSQYDQALAAYYRASVKFPAEFSRQPSAQINRGEALYWLGQLDRSGAQFTSFLKQFPGHPAGWRALLRNAEIAGRKPGQAAADESRTLFLDTVNRFPFSPGAVIARMRLIPCGDHGGFDARTATEFFKNETEKFDGQGEVRMEHFGEFRSAIRVRSLILLDDPVAALDSAIREKDEINRKSGVHAWLGDMERKLFRKQILDLLDGGKKFEAVQFFDKYAPKVNLSETLPEDVTPDRVAAADPEYLLRLSRVASEIGLGRTAEEISKRYALEAKKLGVGRTLASADLDARLKDSERAFTNAKAAWTQDGKKNEPEIRTDLNRMVDESPFAFQKEIILGMMSERDKKWASALSHASRAALLLGKMTSDDSVERQVLDQWTARLYVKAENFKAALEMFRRLQRPKVVAQNSHAKAEGVGLSGIDSRANWILEEAELAGKLGRWGESAEAFGRAVDGNLGGNRAVVGYALSLEKAGKNEEKVSELLKKAAESGTDDFWKDLARKKLAGTNAMEGKAL
ncbi:MAG: tetratricopeptide repeat protein [Cryobacterium sp.]|nr:tetratricopeptide repeat protein [Oligoflexia bacterium]